MTTPAPTPDLACDDLLPDDPARRAHPVPLVLLHGFPLDRTVNREVARQVAGVRRVLNVDLPGFGESPAVGAFSIPDLARHVRHFLMRKGALPCVLGGLSMGGYVALAYHRLFRADLRGLVLIDTKAEADTPEAKANRDRMIDIANREGSAAIARLMLPRMMAPAHSTPGHPLVQRLMEVMSACPAETVAVALAAMRDRDDYLQDLLTTDLPVLVVTGEHDVITPPSLGEQTAARCRRGRFARIDGAGHMAPLERPEAVAGAIRSFLADVH